MKHKHSKSSLFLMEIIINILFFSIIFVVGLQLFVKAHMRSIQTTELQQAVTCVENVASIYESCNGSYDAFMQLCPNYDYGDSEITIYLNQDFMECEKADYKYYISITPESDSFMQEMKPGQLVKTHIQCYDKEDSSIYEISQLCYTPLTSESKSGGAINE